MRPLCTVALAVLFMALWQSTANANFGYVPDPIVEPWVAELVHYLDEDAHAIDPEIAAHFQSGQTVNQAEIVTLIDQLLEAGRANDDRRLVICALKLAMHYEQFIAVTDFQIEPVASPYRATGNDIPEALFTLVPSDHWAYKAFSYLQRHGMLRSYPPDFFSGKELHNRYEFAVAVARLLDDFDGRELDPDFYSSGLDEEQLQVMLEALRSEFAEQLSELIILVKDEDKYMVL